MRQDPREAYDVYEPTQEDWDEYSVWLDWLESQEVDLDEINRQLAEAALS